MSGIAPKDRLIFALDVPTRDDALRLVDDLEGLVSFFKVGWELFLSGGVEDLIRQLARGKQVFLDLKVPDDIPETIRRAVAWPVSLGVKFLTLSMGANAATIRTAREARGSREFPRLLSVPLLSSLSGEDIQTFYGVPADKLGPMIEERARIILDAGCDGLIASGESIKRLRDLFPGALIVSPGIRPRGFPADDHKRLAAPSEAISMGADYLVVGRPIRDAQGRGARRKVAQAIVDEIDRALAPPSPV